MLRLFLPLTIAATLLAPLAVLAEDAPAAPATPAAPTAPMHKNNNRVGGTIASVDAAAKTVTLTHHNKSVVLSVPDGTKIYKIGERGKNGATGTWADLTVGAMISASITGDEAAPVAKEVHLRAPRTTPATMPATPAPATP